MCAYGRRPNCLIVQIASTYRLSKSQMYNTCTVPMIGRCSIDVFRRKLLRMVLIRTSQNIRMSTR